MPKSQTYIIDPGKEGVVVYDMDRGDYLYILYEAVKYLIHELEKIKPPDSS